MMRRRRTLPMKLADIQIDDLILAIETVQQEWINSYREEKREPTDIEQVTVFVLHATAGVFRKVKNFDWERQPDRYSNLLRNEPKPDA
jgi:hypothetical protein